jgi:hypothetical protein
MEILIGALPILLVQAQFNLSQYGALFATGYKVQLQTSFLPEMLFHPWAGVFVWAPITILAMIGLIRGAIQHDFTSILSLIVVMLVLISVSFQGNWWGGCSFGQRFITHLFFFWAIGLSQWIGWMKNKGVVVCVAPALWTFFLFHVFFMNAASPEVRRVLDANKCRRTPVEMIEWAYRDYESSGTANPVAFWFESAGSRPYPTLLFALQK